jgi:hypothetical protein
MSMLLLMPWCPVEREIKVGDVRILPFKRSKDCDCLTPSMWRRIKIIMGMYRDLHGNKIDRAALVKFQSKSVTDDLSQEEISIAYELVTLACFCGLTNREYFNAVGSYCNSDCFTLYVQKFARDNFTALTPRRREGQVLDAWPMRGVKLSVPVNCRSIQGITLDQDLLSTLVNLRKKLSYKAWARWHNAILCFNQANTDSENVRYQVEWVLLCSAFEHLMGAKANAKDVARRFSEIFVPANPLLVSEAKKIKHNPKKEDNPLRHEWMSEFYRIRGDFAHGKLSTKQPMIWDALEHLVLGTIAFPLVVKCLLEKESCYKMTIEDRAQIDAFEEFADTVEFLKPPNDSKGSLDSFWWRYVTKRRWKATTQQIYQQHMARRFPEKNEVDKKNSLQRNKL